MTEFNDFAAAWLARTLFAGGVLLAGAGVLVRMVGVPVLREKLAAWAMRGAVLTAVFALFPAWLTVQLPSRDASKAEPAIVAPVVAAPPVAEPEPPTEDDVVFVAEVASSACVPTAPVMEIPTPPAPAAVTPPIPQEEAFWTRATILSALLIAYGVFAAIAMVQLMLSLMAVLRLRRSGRPLPVQVAAMVPAGAPTVLQSARIAAPVCFGIRRPTILLPESLCRTATDDELRWVLAHEMDHLARGDTRTGLWVGAARSVYFVLPWFWTLRRDLRLAQEYLADAAAAADRTADYAEFLVQLADPSSVRRTPSSPLAAEAMLAMRPGRSELFRRIRMLTQPQTPARTLSRCSSLFTAGGVLAAAVGLSGLGLADDKKPKKNVDVEVVIVEDGRKDGEKKDGDKKKTTEHRDVIVKAVAAGNDDVEKLSKAVSAALEKGDVDAAKDALAKLQKALAAPKVMMLQGSPKVMMFEGNALAPLGKPAGGEWQMVPAAPLPPIPPAVPGEPAPAMAPRIAIFRLQESDEVVKKMEAKIASLKKALAEVKDSPEAREALEKTIAEFNKKIEDARKTGQLKVEGMHLPAQNDFFEFRALPDAAHAKDVLKAQIEQLREQLAKLKAGEADEARVQAAKAQIDALEAVLKAQAEMPQFKAFGGTGTPGQGWAMARPSAGRLGIMVAEVPEAMIDQFDLPRAHCILITGVTEGSVAAKAGLKANDVLLSLDGKDVSSKTDELTKQIAGIKAEEKFNIVVLRKGKKETIKDVTLPKPLEMKARVRKVEESDSIKGEKPEGQSSYSSLTVNVNNGNFTIEAHGNDGSYAITGHLEDGKPVPSEIVVTHGKESVTYKSLEKMPKSGRAAVEQLLKNVRGR